MYQYTGPLPPLVQMFQDMWKASKAVADEDQAKEGGEEDGDESNAS